MLSRLNDFLMNPPIQGYSGTAPETSRNAFGTNQGTNEDVSQSDSHREAGISHNQTTQNSGPEDGHDMVTGVHEEVTYAPLIHLQESRKRTALPVNHNSAVRILLRRSKEIKMCWPFSSWQTTTILQTLIIISTEFPNCQNRSPQRCQRLTGNLRSLNCLKIFSKRASKFIISWLAQKMTTAGEW